jgi:hypothetical protein
MPRKPVNYRSPLRCHKFVRISESVKDTIIDSIALACDTDGYLDATGSSR